MTFSFDVHQIKCKLNYNNNNNLFNWPLSSMTRVSQNETKTLIHVVFVLYNVFNKLF